MNILFLMKVFEVGGQEKVTAVLAEKFARRGNNVVIASFAKPVGIIANNLSSSVKLVDLQSPFRFNAKVVRKLVNILIEKKIDVIINQWGLPFVPIKVISIALHSSDGSISPLAYNPHLKVISIYHNDPSNNARIQGIKLALDKKPSFVKAMYLKAKYLLMKKVTSHSMRYVYNHSDQYQVLSKSYVDHFKQYTGIDDLDKLRVMTNPMTVDASRYSYDFHQKDKEIIFCGRIDYNQKRVSRLIDVWSVLEKRFPDWRLTIVGDGIMREPLEHKVQELCINRVSFEGFQDPIEYYKRASMLMLVSEYEGFPLVLAEAMSFGVVPAVYFSYSAAADIINDGENGILVDRPSDGEFPTTVFADRMTVLMSDENKLHEMQLKAIEKSKEYSLDNIYAQWEKVLNELVSK